MKMRGELTAPFEIMNYADKIPGYSQFATNCIIPVFTVNNSLNNAIYRGELTGVDNTGVKQALIFRLHLRCELDRHKGLF